MTVLELSNEKARKYFMDPQCYGATELPSYFDFGCVLSVVEKSLPRRGLSHDALQAAKDLDGVNYTLVGNKDGKYAWRPLQFIHPVLYVDLVRRLTTASSWKIIQDRFSQYRSIAKIECISLPVVSDSSRKTKAEQILKWWSGFEQRSLELALRYKTMLSTDITDCYGSIYTHSIAWALHGKETAKAKRQNKSLLGNVIDSQIQAMRYGQTNGIPQGSVLMDLVAETVLGYVDELLDRELADYQGEDYFILRYRDDYRIFVNDTWIGEKILKALTSVLSGMGMRLNSAKTKVSDNIINDSVKSDKLAWLSQTQSFNVLSFEKKLLLLYRHASQFPNCGSLMQPLTDLHKAMPDMFLGSDAQIKASLSVVVELAYRNPKCYQMCMAIVAELLQHFAPGERRNLAVAILEKFNHLPNCGYLQLWLQRILVPCKISLDYPERLCMEVSGSTGRVWNSDWLGSEPTLQQMMSQVDIINRDKLVQLKETMSSDEVELFIRNYERNYQG